MMYSQSDIDRNRRQTGRELCFMLLAAVPFAMLAVIAFLKRIELLCMAGCVLAGSVEILIWDLYVSPCRQYGRYLAEIHSGLTRRMAGMLVRIGEDRVFEDGLWFVELILNVYEDLSAEGERRFLLDCAKEKPAALIGQDVELTIHGSYVLGVKPLHAETMEEEAHE